MFTPKEMKEAIERIIRPHGEWVLAQTPDVIGKFADELNEYVIKVLKRKGFNKRDALLLYNAKLLGEIMDEIISLKAMLARDDDE